MPKSTLIAWLVLLAALWAGATTIHRGAGRLLTNDVLALWLTSTAAALAAFAGVGVAVSKGRSLASWATAFICPRGCFADGKRPLVAALLAFLRNRQVRLGT